MPHIDVLDAAQAAALLNGIIKPRLRAGETPQAWTPELRNGDIQLFGNAVLPMPALAAGGGSRALRPRRRKK